MARCTFVDGIKTVWGAIDSVKEGQENRRRLVVRRHEYTENNYDENGSKWHELFYYHFHEGAWSDGATRNREMIKAAQRTAHDIESKPELAQEREEWVARYAAYRATIPEGSKRYYHFYQFVYVTILREMRE
ncbi:MAG: hypothetical protein IK073_01560 [Paludibacteraceae bacterium]|nr:hypothetical protein [Paludibacteraceae bacterium]